MSDSLVSGLNTAYGSHIVVPPKSSSDLYAESNYASEFHDKIVEMIGDFEENLDDEHEVGIRLVNFGQTVVFHLQDIGYYNPSLIRFMGKTDDNNFVELIQHVSQISILLMQLPKLDEDKPARRIGFETGQSTSSETDES